tara:strand:- start:383 stop:1018 length:636 start_codon:yes stop_codon:yes gene_type:complete
MHLARHTLSLFGSKTSGDSRALVDAQVSQVLTFVGDLPVSGDRQGFCDLTFGYRAGPSVTTGSLLHEMAHCAQLREKDLSRVSLQGYGFSVKHVEVMGQHYPQPETTQALEREAEVFAMEILLAKRVFPDFDVEHYLEDFCLPLIRYFSDYYNIPLSPHCETLAAKEQARKDWMRNQVHTHLSKYTADIVKARLLSNYQKISERLTSVANA